MVKATETKKTRIKRAKKMTKTRRMAMILISKITKQTTKITPSQETPKIAEKSKQPSRTLKRPRRSSQRAFSRNSLMRKSAL